MANKTVSRIGRWLGKGFGWFISHPEVLDVIVTAVDKDKTKK